MRFYVAGLVVCLVASSALAGGRFRGRHRGHAYHRPNNCQVFRTYGTQPQPTFGTAQTAFVSTAQPIVQTAPGVRILQTKGTNTTQVIAAGTSALSEVNATRAARGLPPYIEDTNLTSAASAAAKFRAERLISGHTSNDFAFLPPGAFASAAGCAAWPQGMGWGSCATYDNYRFAGASYAIGRDGQRYMHLFVR